MLKKSDIKTKSKKETTQTSQKIKRETKQSKTKIKKETIPKQKRKTPIKKALRMKLWDETIGDTTNGKCYCCDRQLKVDNFEAGHIIAEANGGETIITNLKVICKPCNGSCGTMNLEDFKRSLTGVGTLSTNVNDIKLNENPRINDFKVNNFKNDDIKIVEHQEKNRQIDKELLIDRINTFFEKVKNMEEMKASKIIRHKDDQIKKITKKIKNENQNVHDNDYLANIENIIKKHDFMFYGLKYKHHPVKKTQQRYDDWFTNIQCELMNYMSDPNVVIILNEAF
jgi:5-methylcytosine-specific restriction endonuclease McrA